MPTSLCFNCGAAKSPPYTQHYCDDCEAAVASARDNALAQGGNPSEAARKALDTRAFDPKGTRPNPRTPFTTRDATQNALRALNMPPNWRP